MSWYWRIVTSLAFGSVGWESERVQSWLFPRGYLHPVLDILPLHRLPTQF